MALRSIWLMIGTTPQYYPMTYTTFWIEYHLWGLNPAGYHVVNILLQGLNAVVLWRVLRKLELPGAFIAATIFAVHPVHVESVAWIAERKNLLSAFFYLAATSSYLRFAMGPSPAQAKGLASHTASWPFCFLAMFLFACALFSKTVTATWPAAMMLVLWWKRRLSLRHVLLLAPLLVLGAAFGALTAGVEQWRIGAVGPEFSLSVAQRCLVAGRAPWFYLGKLLWPHPLIFIYPRWQVDAAVTLQYLFPFSLAAVILALWLARRRLGRGPLVAALFFAGTLSPAMGFAKVYFMRYSFVADHFQYLASIGPIAAFAAVGSRLVPARWAIGAPAVVLVVLSILTWGQAWNYHDNETLWRDVMARNPAAWIAHNNLGAILETQGKPADAAGEYDIVLQYRPDNAQANVNLGRILVQQGHLEQGAAHLRAALEAEPSYVEAHYYLGKASAGRGDHAEATAHFRDAVRLKPMRASYHLALAQSLEGQQLTDEAMAHYRQALALDATLQEATAALARLTATTQPADR